MDMECEPEHDDFARRVSSRQQDGASSVGDWGPQMVGGAAGVDQCGGQLGDLGRTSDTGGPLLPPRRLPTGRPTTFGKQALGHASPANPALTNCMRRGKRGGGGLGDTVQHGTHAWHHWHGCTAVLLSRAGQQLTPVPMSTTMALCMAEARAVQSAER